MKARLVGVAPFLNLKEMNPYEELGRAFRDAATAMRILTAMLNEALYIAPYGKTDEVLDESYSCEDADMVFLFSTN